MAGGLSRFRQINFDVAKTGLFKSEYLLVRIDIMADKE